MTDERKNKAEDASERFGKGYYCSQAILSAYCADLGLDGKSALKISCGLGAGMGRTGQTCGAVTGAYLVIGLKHGSTSPDDKEAVERTFSLIQEFDRIFTEEHGSVNCRELLGADLRYGDQAAAGEKVKAVCPRLVKDAAEILERIL
ncbi:MAG: C-GCAxxG-C-C family protein [Methanomassiliicoccaceae archaeon]|nr:C-GCAxxG-C-C family protein [Methanomassiliicoccaceae archaeon]